MTELTTSGWEPVRYTHFGLGAGHCTIAYQLDSNRGAPKRAVRFAVAYTAPGDRFSRKIGRAISSGRLTKGKFSETVVSLAPGTPSRSDLFHVLEAVKVLAFEKAPSWKKDCLIEKKANGVVEVSKDDVTYVLFE